MVDPAYKHILGRSFTKQGSVGKDLLLANKVRFERVDLLYRLSLLSLIATFVNTAIVVIGLWGSVDNQYLSIWAAIILVVVSMRFALVKIYQNSRADPDQAKRWEYFFSCGTFMMGLTWAALAWGFFPQSDTLHQLLIAFVLAGMMAGSTGVLAPSLLAYLSFNLPPTVAMVFLLFSNGETAYTMMGLMVLVFMAIQTRAADFYRQRIDQTSISYFNNEALLEKVQQTEKKMTDAIESFPDGFALFDTMDQLILCNSKYVAAHGIHAGVENLIGKKFTDLARMAVEEGEILEAEAGNRSYYLRGDTQGKGSIQMSLHGDSITIHSDSMRTSAAETSLKKMQMELKVLLAISQEAIALIQNKIVVDCNIKLKQLLGYGSDKLSPKALSASLISNQFSVGNGATIYAQLQDGNVHQGELDLLRKDGTSLHCNYTAKAADPLDINQTTVWTFTEIVH